MYEWHGWATLRRTPAVDYDELDDELDKETMALVRGLLGEADTTFNQAADLRYTNGQWHVWLAGFRNHHDPTITTLFQGIARTAPGSYGVLYTFDDEASDSWDRWVMRRGNVFKAQDEDLSPHVGMVEDPEEFN